MEQGMDPLRVIWRCSEAWWWAQSEEQASWWSLVRPTAARCSSLSAWARACLACLRLVGWEIESLSSVHWLLVMQVVVPSMMMWEVDRVRVSMMMVVERMM